jgi:hypothetical protein
MNNTRVALDDVKIHVKFKIAALWTSVMFCYIYADYFNLYEPGKLQGMIAGRMGPLGPVTQAMLLGASLMLAIPAVMVFLSLVMQPKINRTVNITLGLAYTLIIVVTMPGSWAFYIFYGVVEVLLTLLVAWYAWSWPRTSVAASAQLVKDS